MRRAICCLLVIAIGIAVWFQNVGAPNPPVPDRSAASGEDAAAFAATSPLAPSPTGALVHAGNELRSEAAPVPPASIGMRVCVVDGDEQPIVDAAVESIDEPKDRARTDRDGFATLSVPIAGSSVHLRVQAGVRHHQSTFQRLPGLAIRLPWAGPVRGTIVDDATGATVDGAAVTRHHNYCKGCEPDRAVSDARGFFELPAVPRDEDCVIVFEAPGYPRQWQRLRLPGRGERVDHTFRLQRGAAIAGRCIDLTTKLPIAGVRVSRDGEVLATTTADGGFRTLVLVDGERTVPLRFEAKGYCQTMVPMVVPQPDPAFELLLSRTASLTGRVLAGDGRPVAGARVRSSLMDGPACPWLPAGSSITDEQVGGAFGRSAEDGTFVLTGLTLGGTHMVRVGHDDFSVPPELRFGKQVELREDTPPIELVLVAKPAIAGRGSIAGTLCVNGTPTLGLIEWRAKARSGQASSDAVGRFRLEGGPAGRVQVTARSQAFEHASGEALAKVVWTRDVEVEVDRATRLDIDHRLDMAAITGRVLFADGAPAVSQSVAAFPPELSGARYFARCDAEGRFQLAVPVAVARWQVSAGPAFREVAPGGVADLVIDRPSRLRLRITDERGRVVPASLFLAAPGERYFAPYHEVLAPDPDGYVAQTLPQRGEYTLLLHAPGFAPEVRTVQAPPTAALDVRMQRGVTLTVRARADATLPAEPLHVRLVDEPFAGYAAEATSVVSMLLNRRFALSREGTRVADLGPGTHRLVAADAEIELVPDQVVVGASDTEVEVTWRRRSR